MSEVMSLGAAASSVATDLQGIVRSEVDLAKAEMGQQVKHAVRVSIWGAVAAAFAFFGFLFLLVCAMLGLAEVVDLWLAALIVAAGALLVAGIAALLARARLKQIHVVPERTVRSSKETVIWARDQMRSNGGLSSSAGTRSRRSRT